jgi:hypothetical protein
VPEPPERMTGIICVIVLRALGPVELSVDLGMGGRGAEIA